MAKANVEKFFAAVMADEDKKNRLQELGKFYGDKQLDEVERIGLIEDHILPMAKEMGSAFTLDELKAYEAEKVEDLKQKNSDGELSEEELEAVSGGLTAVGTFCIIIGIGAGATSLSGVCHFIGFGF